MELLVVLCGILALVLVYKSRALKDCKEELTKLKATYASVDNAQKYADTIRCEADQYANNIKAEAEELSEQEKERLKNDYMRKLDVETKSIKQTISDLKKERKELKQEVTELRRTSEAEAVTIDAYSGLKSDEVKNRLAILQMEQTALVKDGKAVDVIGSYGDAKHISTQSKQMLRCFNSECVGIISSVTARSADACRGKIQRSYEALNRLFKTDSVQISSKYLESKFEELSLVYAYMVKQEEEKEQRKAIREQLVEEEKVRREIEKEKQKLDKEMSQFTGEVKKLMGYMQKAKDDIERQLYLDKIADLEAKLKVLEADKENVLEREQNTRAGYVYIISNIGSFGERVFKIGMTRRLEPMDRIAELSSASVPFPFDVHALIFSDDAPALETILHQHFDAARVNKVNPRKEFFRVDLEEIKNVVLKNHNATVHFVDIPDAMEYRETMAKEQPVSA